MNIYVGMKEVQSLELFCRLGLLHEVQVFAPGILTSDCTSVSFAQPHSNIYSLPLQQQQHFHIFRSSDILSVL